MAKSLVVTISGVGVYSDKRMSSVADSKVSFDDGSWCDVATGQVVNKGTGYISIGRPTVAGDAKKKTYGPKRFSAKYLDLENVDVDVEVSVVDGDEMTVTIEGPESEVNGIDVSQKDGTLVIRGKRGESGIRGTNVVISGSGISIGGSGITVRRGGFSISGGGGENETKLSVGVPKGSAVTVSEVDGKVTIGDTEGPLSVSASAGKTVSAGRVTGAMLKADSGSRVTVKEVSGVLVAHADSGAEIVVRAGQIGILVANVSSAARIDFSGAATHGQLGASSGGCIQVARIINKPQQQVSSGGRINVRNR